MGRALITSAGTRVAYCICRNLRAHSIEPVMADSDPLAMSFWSRHAAGRRLYASPFRDEEGFIKDLLRIIARERIDVLIPVLEETYFVARHRARLAPHVRLFLADYADLIALHDKATVLATARRLGVATPQTQELTEVLATEGAGVRFPAVLKPKQGGGGWSVRDADDFERLRRLASELDAPVERYLVQEKITGPIAGVAMLYRDGALIAADSYWTLQTYPHPHGQPTIRLSRNFPQAVAGLRAILDDRRWSGPCQADFLHDEARNESFLIDVNPRFWGSVGQSIARGIDFPYYYYQCAMGETEFRVPADPPPVATRWLGGDMIRKLRARSGIASTRPDSPVPGAFAAVDDFEPGDPLPLVGWGASQAWRAVRSACGLGAGRDALDGVWT